jgi:hypothetical protein
MSKVALSMLVGVLACIVSPSVASADPVELITESF